MNAIVFHGFHGFAVFAFGAAFNAHHHGLAGAVNVGIEQAHTGAFCGQRQRQIDGGSALAHAAFARSNSHDVFHLRQQGHAALGCMGHNFGGDIGRYVGDTGHLFGGCNEGIAQTRNLTLGGIAQLDIKGHVAAVHHQILECFGGHKIFARIGVNDGFEGFLELF